MPRVLAPSVSSTTMSDTYPLAPGGVGAGAGRAGVLPGDPLAVDVADRLHLGVDLGDGVERLQHGRADRGAPAPWSARRWRPPAPLGRSVGGTASWA